MMSSHSNELFAFGKKAFESNALFNKTLNSKFSEIFLAIKKGKFIKKMRQRRTEKFNFPDSGK